MTSLRDAVGKPAITRAGAEQVGDVRTFAVDAATRRVTILVLASGRARGWSTGARSRASDPTRSSSARAEIRATATTAS